MALLEPGDVLDHRGPARFDAPVIAIDGFVPADRRVPEAVGLLFGHEHLDILAQRALVALEREDVVGGDVPALLLTVEMRERITAKSRAPSCDRKPPEIFC